MTVGQLALSPHSARFERTRARHRINEDLKKKGVQFAGAPEDRFYGVEAIMKDGLGNWFSMTQPKAWQG